MNERYACAVIRYMIGLFYRGDSFKEAKYYTDDMVCIAPKFRRKRICRILHRTFRICLNEPAAVAVTGSYRLECITEGGRRVMPMCRYSALMQYRSGALKLTMLHISEEPGAVFRLTDVVEHTYFLGEEEILYLESGHNRVYWHTGKETVEVADTLLHAESRLPDTFVRIHKSFIVNSLHVERINRCYAELSNGERLQIPVKRYTDVRKKLIVKRESPEQTEGQLRKW
ncbi:MAG: LytTR family transcriptional regulator DNA-binding domain-containing protein [Butyrivibrio sp.]|nr:LytTR family transcriptional regulator DNA-binding domain-containing protein [Acetatifactor muris]MCM1560024.1 LytTR family transcriptional regulator DNA-binding domain-containing protein [Butyrivibrio sp.]